MIPCFEENDHFLLRSFCLKFHAMILVRLSWFLFEGRVCNDKAALLVVLCSAFTTFFSNYQICRSSNLTFDIFDILISNPLWSLHIIIMDPNEEPIDLSDPELEKAATKIQATFKGFKARKEIREEGPPAAKGDDNQPTEVSMSSMSVSWDFAVLSSLLRGKKERKWGMKS